MMDSSRAANCQQFLSTLSLRRATDYVRYCIHARGISIHALLAESDPDISITSNFEHTFLSTLSLRRATAPPYN